MNHISYHLISYSIQKACGQRPPPPCFRRSLRSLESRMVQKWSQKLPRWISNRSKSFHGGGRRSGQGEPWPRLGLTLASRWPHLGLTLASPSPHLRPTFATPSSLWGPLAPLGRPREPQETDKGTQESQKTPKATPERAKRGPQRHQNETEKQLISNLLVFCKS